MQTNPRSLPKQSVGNAAKATATLPRKLPRSEPPTRRLQNEKAALSASPPPASPPPVSPAALTLPGGALFTTAFFLPDEFSGTDSGNTGVGRLRICGRLDIAGVIDFRDAVFTAMGHRPRLLILDLTEAIIMDAAALETLIVFVRVARRVRLCFSIEPSPRLHRALTITGLDRVLPLRGVGVSREERRDE